MSQTEILAPVGNMDMLRAALAAGVDAIYLAVDDFGARAYAKNFSLDNIQGVIDLIHLFDRRVFITMNTLLKDSEIDRAICYAQKLYEFGVDGLLIQDIGFYNIIKDQMPNIDFHASTQMAVRDYHGAKALMNLGFKRIVIARETPIDEIEKIATLPCEKEVFVHGSLCVSYSGECLFSSYFGQRSANRGRCAGPCRLRYDLLSDGKVFTNDYYLNMKDLNVLDYIDKLIDLGIDCLKIEGRMKSPEYVYTSVRSYKEKIKKREYSKTKLRDISNRGYTKGFIFGQKKDYILKKDDPKHRSVAKVTIFNNKKSFVANSNLYKGDNLQVITDKGKRLPLTLTDNINKGQRLILDKYKDAKIGSDILMLNSIKVKDDLQQALNTYRNLSLDMEFEGRLKEKAKLKLRHNEFEVMVESKHTLEQAKNVSIDEDAIIENLSKLNDEIFNLNNIDIYLDNNIFIKKKTINKLRRDGISKLQKAISQSFKRIPISINKNKLKAQRTFKKQKNIELMTNDIDPKLLEGFDNVYIKSYHEKYKGFNLYLNLDSHEDYKIEKLISYIKDNNIKGVIFNNYRDLDFIDAFKKADIKIRIGRYMNVFNSYSFDFYDSFAEKISSSVENTLDNINKNAKAYSLEALSFGRIELMNMFHCPFSTIKKCGLKGCSSCKFAVGQMISEAGDKLKVIRENNITKIYPYSPAGIDENLFGKEVSTLVSVFTDDDIIAYRQSVYEHTLNYKRGVI